MRLSRKSLATAFAAVILVAACSSSGGGASGAPSGGALTPVKFHLKWVAQTQFAGYYAAVDQGYYKDLGLDVSLVLGGPNITIMARTQSKVERSRTTSTPLRCRGFSKPIWPSHET